MKVILSIFLLELCPFCDFSVEIHAAIFIRKYKKMACVVIPDRKQLGSVSSFPKTPSNLSGNDVKFFI